jgi:hypothetical protein
MNRACDCPAAFSQNKPVMILFKLLWVIDAIVALIFLYFFFVGLGDGTVTGRNIVEWIFILAALTGVLWGSIWLRQQKHPYLALALVLILAIPAILFVMYFGMAIAGHERWN